MNTVVQIPNWGIKKLLGLFIQWFLKQNKNTKNKDFCKFATKLKEERIQIDIRKANSVSVVRHILVCATIPSVDFPSRFKVALFCPVNKYAFLERRPGRFGAIFF